MKSRYSIVVAIVVLLLIGAGYFYFNRSLKKEQADVWSFVPEHAVVVYESQGITAAWNSLEEQPAAQILGALPWYTSLKNKRSLLDSLTENLETLFQKRKVHTSLHITENNNFDYLFYLPLQGVADYSALKKVLINYQNDADFRFTKRFFHGVEIQEITHKTNSSRFSYFINGGYLVSSFTPFLVEDVIRQLDEDKETGGFRQEHQKIFQLSHMDEDQGNLYVNGGRLGAFLNLFLKNSHFSPSFPYASKLDVAATKDGLLMNGYTIVEEGEVEPYLQSLLHEKPQELDVAQLVPLRTAYLRFFGFGKGPEWHRKLLNEKAVPGWEKLNGSYPGLIDFVALLGKRIALAAIPAPGEEEHRLLYLHTTNGDKAAGQLREVALKVSQSKGDSLFQEEFGGSLITQLPYKEFPEAVFGPAFSGFAECFYLQYNNYLVFSNSIQELKTMLLDIEAENTWQKSVQVYQFMQKTNQEVNFGLYVNTERIWKLLVAEAEPEWKSFLENYGPYLRQFNMMALQFSSLEDMFYTNFLLQASPKEVQDLQQLRFTLLHETLLKAPAACKPMLVKNNRQKSRNLFVQDTLNVLYLLDSQGDILKTDSLLAPVIGEVFQLDLAKNNQAEYLIATQKGLYLYGASLNRKAGYPVAIPGNAGIEWASVIDYNGSKMYRILVADRVGDLYMFDLQGNNLDGWKPRKLGGALSDAPGHIRVRGKDCIYAFEKSGVVHVMNRRGESYNGFPLNLKDALLGPVVIKTGSDFNNTVFTTITKGGELISFNLNGNITRQAQFFKPDANSSFFLVQDKMGGGFIVIRQSANRLSILDPKGSLLFEKDYLGAANVQVQYFSFGADKELIAVTDQAEEFTYLYDKKGNLLNFEPLNSCCPLSIQLEDESGGYQVYKAYEDKVSLLKGVD